jgi:hypothetical protein
MNYDIPEVLEIGRAADLIHGSDKTEQNFLDSPVFRTSISVVEDVEVLEIGRAEDLIHGSDKTEQNFLDSPVFRTSISVVEDVEN